MKGEELADDDPQMSYMISAWARICKILGAGFAPYLPMVMAPVMKTASMKPEVALLDNDEVEGVGDERGAVRCPPLLSPSLPFHCLTDSNLTALSLSLSLSLSPVLA